MVRDRRLAEVASIAFEPAEDGAWLSRISRAFEEEWGEGLGCVAATYAPTETSIGFDTVVGPGPRPDIDPRHLFEGTVAAPPEMTRRAYAEVTCETTSALGPVCARNFQERSLDWGVRDAVCVNVQAHAHRGAAFMLLLPRTRRLRMVERRWLDDLAAVLRIAVQRRAAPEHVVSPPARPPGSRATEVPLPDETRRLQLAGFQPIRELAEDGRRRLVVERISVDPLAVLSARERAAVLALRTVTSNKEVAALLGTQSSTVGVLLHRAAAKLRARSRRELAAIAANAPSRDGA